MNMTSLIDQIKKECGIGDFLKIRMTDDQICKNIIQGLTIPVFSRYFKHSLLLYNVGLTRINDSGRYKINIPKEIKAAMKHMGVLIKGVKEFHPNRKSSAGFGYTINQFTPTMVPVAGNLTAHNPFAMEAMADAFSMVSAVEAMDIGCNHVFVEPDILQFYEHDMTYEDSLYDITVFTSHSNNLSTIQDNLANSFSKLALLDLKRILWDSELKYMNGVETTYIKVDLKIDDWAQAAAQRDELLRLWESMPFSNNSLVVGI